jgi:hypothetical protein
MDSDGIPISFNCRRMTSLSYGSGPGEKRFRRRFFRYEDSVGFSFYWPHWRAPGCASYPSVSDERKDDLRYAILAENFFDQTDLTLGRRNVDDGISPKTLR